jgi:hypothetical protein
MTFEIGLLQPIFVYQFGPLVFKRVLHATLSYVMNIPGHLHRRSQKKLQETIKNDGRSYEVWWMD